MRVLQNGSTSGDIINDRCMLTVGEDENVSDTRLIFHKWIMNRGQLSELGRMIFDHSSSTPTFTFDRMAFVTGLNNRGRAVGAGIRSDNNSPFGLQWQRGELSKFPRPSSGHIFIPGEINDFDVVIGTNEAEDQSEAHGVLYVAGQYLDLRRFGIDNAYDLPL